MCDEEKEIKKEIELLWERYNYHLETASEIKRDIEYLEDLLDEEDEPVEEWEEYDEDED